MKKGTAWRWGASQMRAFEETKNMLLSVLLTHFSPSKPILVQVDTSLYGLGAVMPHTMEDVSQKLVCYISRMLSDAERNYAYIKKEGLAWFLL